MIEKCTKLEDIFKPENKDKKYSYEFVARLVVEHIPFCPDCFKLWEEKYSFKTEGKKQK